MHTQFLFLVSLVIVAFVPTAEAQLSQLEFDAKAKEQATPTPSPQEVLKLLEEDERKPDPPTPVAVGGTAVQVSLSVPKSISVVLVDVPDFDRTNARLIPRTEGPFADSGSASKLTSRASWKRSNNGQCGEPSSEHDAYLKAKALKEVMYRYSGGDVFYDGLSSKLCASHCLVHEDTQAWMSGFAVGNIAGAQFTLEQKDERCYYLITRAEGTAWKVLEGQKVVCTCLPNKYR